MAAPMFRFDPVELPPEALALRAEVREFIKEQKQVMGFGQDGFNREFSRVMGRRGWIGMTWPKQYGGHERSAFERYVLIEEMLAAGAPLSAHYTGDRQSGPNILRFGTEEQKQFFCPRIAAGELTFCIGMSEPNSGSGKGRRRLPRQRHQALDVKRAPGRLRYFVLQDGRRWQGGA
jgi:alkylation response protein AidB-like acyl-CoA dehydrogenase